MVNVHTIPFKYNIDKYNQNKMMLILTYALVNDNKTNKKIMKTNMIVCICYRIKGSPNDK